MHHSNLGAYIGAVIGVELVVSRDNLGEARSGFTKDRKIMKQIE